MEDETPLHLLPGFTKTKYLLKQLKDYIANKTLAISLFTAQSAFLEFNELSFDYLLSNHITPIFKFYMYCQKKLLP